jgi:hypothetical protein
MKVFGQQGFDTGSVPPAEDFAIIPPGKYASLIEKAEVKPTKAGDGCYIELTCAILEEGPTKGRKFWDRINIANPSQDCVAIGLRSLAALGKALGIPVIQDTAQLVNQVVVAHIKVDKHDQNAVRTYSAAGAAPAAAPATPYQPPYQPPQQAQAPVYAPPQAPPQQQWQPPQSSAPPYPPMTQPQYTPPQQAYQPPQAPPQQQAQQQGLAPWQRG